MLASLAYDLLIAGAVVAFRQRAKLPSLGCVEDLKLTGAITFGFLFLGSGFDAIWVRWIDLDLGANLIFKASPRPCLINPSSPLLSLQSRYSVNDL